MNDLDLDLKTFYKETICNKNRKNILYFRQLIIEISCTALSIRIFSGDNTTANKLIIGIPSYKLTRCNSALHGIKQDKEPVTAHE